MRASSHPIYKDDSAVGKVTDLLMDSGHTVFQMFMYGDERHHSLRLLRGANLPANAKVISFGCGIGGMEAYWKAERPDLQFTLVNISQAQLDRCVCEGRKICANIEDVVEPGHDLSVMCYALGHVDHARAFRNARLSSKHLLINDVFNASLDFKAYFCYDPPELDDLPERLHIRVGELELAPHLRHLPIEGQVVPALVTL